METATKRRRGRRGNKSAMIRDYFAEHPEAGPTEVVAAFKEKKIRVTPTLVSNVKARMQAGSGGKTAGRRGPRGRRAGSELNLPLSLLLEAKRLAEQAGSVEAARDALDALSQLQ